jgi:hypothetical protein
MKSWYPSPSDSRLYDGSNADFRATLLRLTQDMADDEEIQTFVAGMLLLEKVPLANLIPDETMLPPESLRFFRLDIGWLEALTDGAMSVGRLGEADKAHDALMLRQLLPAGFARSAAIRNEILSLPLGTGQASLARSGFLLRSRLISAWPGLEVRCLRGDDVCPILRLDRLGADIMLCLIEGEMDRVEFTEPAESLHFGFSNEEDRLLCPLVKLHPDADRGEELPGVTVEAEFRPGVRGVVDIGKMRKSIMEKLDGVKALGDHMSAVEFGIEMIAKRTRVEVRILRENQLGS